MEKNSPSQEALATQSTHPLSSIKNGPSDYVGTEYTPLQYIGALRGVTWKRIEQSLMEHNGRYIDQIKIETVKTTEEGVIAQIENYYFDIDYFFRRKI